MAILGSWWFVPTLVGLFAHAAWLLVPTRMITIGRSSEDGILVRLTFAIAAGAVVVLGPIAIATGADGVLGAAMTIAAMAWMFSSAYAFFTWIDRADWMPEIRIRVPRARWVHGAIAIVLSSAMLWSILYPTVRWTAPGWHSSGVGRPSYVR